MKNESLESLHEEQKEHHIGIVETMGNEETEYNEGKQDTEMLEKINFNTIEDDQPQDDLKVYKPPHEMIDEENEDVDDTAQEIDGHRKPSGKVPEFISIVDQNRASTIIVSEDAIDEAHNYVQGIIKKNAPISKVSIHAVVV